MLKSSRENLLDIEPHYKGKVLHNQRQAIVEQCLITGFTDAAGNQTVIFFWRFLLGKQQILYAVMQGFWQCVFVGAIQVHQLSLGCCGCRRLGSC